MILASKYIGLIGGAGTNGPNPKLQRVFIGIGRGMEQ